MDSVDRASLATAWQPAPGRVGPSGGWRPPPVVPYGAAVRWIALLLLVWSGVVFLSMLFVGGEIPFVGCLRGAGPTPLECLEQVAALSDERWRMSTLSRPAIVLGGYLLIVLYGLWALRSRRRATAW
jgi:hypothetical protein